MLARRRALDPEVVERHSETVVQRIRSLPEFSGLADQAIIGAYLGIRGEIDPSPLLEDSLLRTALPVTTPGEALRFVIPDGVLVDGPFGIRQPDRGVEVDPTDHYHFHHYLAGQTMAFCILFPRLLIINIFAVD